MELAVHAAEGTPTTVIAPRQCGDQVDEGKGPGYRVGELQDVRALLVLVRKWP